MKTSFKKMTAMLVAFIFLLTSLHIVPAAADNAPATLPDGEYSVPFRYLKDGTTTESVADNFMVKDSGKLIIQDGVAVFEHEVEKYDFQTFSFFGIRDEGAPKAVITTVGGQETATGQEGYTQAVVSDANIEEHVVLQFEIGNIWEKQDILMHINDVNNQYGLPTPYNHWYNAQLELQLEGITPPSDEVNKSKLIQWVAAAEAFVATGKDSGTAESGGPAQTNAAAVSHEEYPVDTSIRPVKGPITKVLEKIQAAQAVIDDDDSTQEQVNAVFNDVFYSFVWEDLAKQQFLASTVNILALDSIGDNAQISEYVNEIGSTAVILQQAAHPYYEAYANITFNDPDNSLINTDIKSPNAATTGLFAVNSAGAPSFSSGLRPLVTLSSADEQKVYQIPVRSGNRTTLQEDSIWQGLAVVRYPESAPVDERKIVYISFNKDQLDALYGLIETAEELLDQATEGTEEGQYSAGAKESLQAAIEKAQETRSKLAAPRPQILSAIAELQSAIDEFKALAVRPIYFSAIHATQDAFSTMENYFVKPALIANIDDSQQITLTIKDSASVAEFKVKQNGEFEDTTIVSEDTAANTRVVTFKADDLSVLLDAQVRTVVPAQNYDRTHTIRLNFNDVDNGALFALIQTATAAHQAAVAGTQPGEYPAAAKTALQTAINAAGAEAIRIPSTGADTAAALAQLQQAMQTFNDSKIASNPTNPSNPSNPGGPGTPPPNPDPVYPAAASYFMNFRILKDGTDATSMMQTYVVSPALVKVSGSTKTVSFTVLQSNEIKDIKINGSSGTVSSRDTSSNTRVVTYTLSNLSSKINGYVRVEWPKYNYYNSYDIQFLFDESSAYYAGTDPDVPGGDGNVGVDPGYENGGGNGQKETKDDDKKEDDKQKQDEKQDGEIKETNGTTQNNRQQSTENLSVQFNDLTNHWAKTPIEQAVKLGIVNGYKDGSFRPNGNVTRAEFAVMISRALGLEGDTDVSSFRDAGSIPAWAQEHVALAAAAGLIGGYQDQTFRSGEQLSRAQLAVIIARAAGLALEDDASMSFTDTDDIPAWAQKEVSAAVKAGLIKGQGNNLFAPNATATRAEALALILRLLDAKEAAAA